MANLQQTIPEEENEEDSKDINKDNPANSKRYKSRPTLPFGGMIETMFFGGKQWSIFIKGYFIFRFMVFNISFLLCFGIVSLHKMTDDYNKLIKYISNEAMSMNEKCNEMKNDRNI